MIVEVRDLVWHLLDTMSVTALKWLPGSPDELPCVVVGRPNLTESGDSRYIVETSTPVFVLGRTVRDDDAQRELDQLADELLSLLWQPRGEGGFSTRLTELQATTVTVAALDDLPAYTATVITTSTIC